MSSPTSARRYVKRSYSSPCDRSDNEPSTPTRSSTRSTHHHTPSNGKMVAIKVVLLDDSVTIIQSQSKTLGRIIFDQIIKQLNVLEADYFGLEYNDENGVHYWLDLEKRLTRQVGLNLSEPLLKFSVKFYTPDPSQLEEEFTRYLFSLEIKRDLSSGVLLCNDNTAALMASFIVQAECGDFSEEDYPDATYLSVYKFIPHQNYELERKIRECHKKHVGQSPAEADLHLLETARRTEMYGIRLHPARDEDGVHLNLSVCHMGVLVFQNNTKINTFSWAKIRKISFKRKRFILKLHPESYFQEGYYKELVEFVFDSRNECKSYWKRCVEHHAFFRCEKAPNPIQRSKGILSSRGSSFRYSGRTQKQMVQFVRENFVKRPPGQYLSQQNLASDNQQAEWKRSSSFKTAKTTKSANNLEYEDDEEEDEMEFSDYTVEKKSPTKSSITSSPLLQQPPLPQLQLFPQNHQNQNIEGNNDLEHDFDLELDQLENQLIKQLSEMHSSSSSEPIPDPLIIKKDVKEFPITSYKTQQKINNCSKKKKLKKVRSKSFTRKSDHHHYSDEEEEEEPSTLPRSDKQKKKKVVSLEGSYDLLGGPLTFAEVDIPYLLRRRIDLDSGHLSLGKSKSYGGSQKKFKLDIGRKLVSYSSMMNLIYKREGFSFKDDSVEDLMIKHGSSMEIEKENVGGTYEMIENVEEDVVEKELAEIKEEESSESSSSGGLGKVAEDLVSEVVNKAQGAVLLGNKRLERKDSFQKMQSLDGIEELPLDEELSSVREIINEIIDEENDENLSECGDAVGVVVDENKKIEEEETIQEEEEEPAYVKVADEVIEEEVEESINGDEEPPENPYDTVAPQSPPLSLTITNSPSSTPKNMTPPPPPLPSTEEYDPTNIQTPRFPPPLGDSAGSRRSSYDLDNPTAVLPSNTLKKALMRSFSIAEEEPQPPPLPPHRSNSLNSQPPPSGLNNIEEELDYIDNSTKTDSNIDSNTTDPDHPIIEPTQQILYKTRFRTLSRISERTHSSYTESRIKDSTIEAPLVTITSELGDSSATLNEINEIDEDLDDLYVEGVVLEEVQEAEIVVDPDTESKLESYSSTCGSTLRKRVEVKLTVFGGEIVFNDNK